MSENNTKSIFSKAVSGIKPSATLSITAKAGELKSQGHWVVSFAAGQPDYDTPQVIKNETIKALESGFTKYTPVSGIPELKEAISRKLKEENKLTYKPSQIIVSNGAKQALFETIFTLVQKGDEVLIPIPYWVSYPEMVKATGAKPVFIETGKDFKLTPDSLKKSITAKSKLLILNAPSNPTGVMYTRKELLELSKVTQESNILVISDECYDRFYYGKSPQVSFASLGKDIYKNTITINALSKSFSMTGWRVGYAAGPEEIISKMSALQSHLSSNPNSFSQKGAAVAFAKARKFPEKMRKEFTKRREIMLSGLGEIEGISPHPPDGAFYIFADVSAIDKDDQKFSLELLEKEKVVVIPGSPFGAPGNIRISFATSMKDIREGLKRIKRFVGYNY